MQGQRGWVNETNRELAADMTVEAKIWFSPSSHQNWLVRQAWDLFEKESLPFPSDKAHAIQVSTNNVENPDQPIFPISIGESPSMQITADIAQALRDTLMVLSLNPNTTSYRNSMTWLTSSNHCCSLAD